MLAFSFINLLLKEIRNSITILKSLISFTYFFLILILNFFHKTEYIQLEEYIILHHY